MLIKTRAEHSRTRLRPRDTPSHDRHGPRYEFAQKYKVSRVSEVTQEDAAAGGDAATTQGSGNGSGSRAAANAAARRPFAAPAILKFYSPSKGFVTVTAQIVRMVRSLSKRRPATRTRPRPRRTSSEGTRLIPRASRPIGLRHHVRLACRATRPRVNRLSELSTLFGLAWLDPTADVTL